MSDFSERVVLGRTGIEVSRLGLGSAYGASEAACLKAFEAGVNYFFWGSVRATGMAHAIRRIARTRREDLVVVLQCYCRFARFVELSVMGGLRSLGLDSADVLLLGWYDEVPGGRVLETVERLREKGLFRFLAISGHQRPLFREFLKDDRYDVFHIRYNAAHPGAERDIFPYLPDEGGPGIVSFTNTRWGDLLKAKNMPSAVSPPTAPDCYRFVLSNPSVQVAVCGPGSDEEMDAGLSVLRSGPMDEEELGRMRVIGDHVHGISSLASFFS